MEISEHLRQLVLQKTREVIDEVKRFRHECHAHPELSWKEEQTSRRIAKSLRQIPGIEVEEGVAQYGVIGLLKGRVPGPTIALRADMDALPLQETSEIPYRSKNQGVMHACGHDGHMANLLGAAKVLASLKDELHGQVKFIFQPAEEGGAGAQKLCEAGVLSNPDVDVIFGLHGWPEAPVGHIWLKDGPLLASNTEIRVRVKGKGCHAAMPHLGSDQVLIASRMIDQLQILSSRMVAPTEPIALSITMIQGGTASNIIPSEVSFAGTLRTVNPETRERCLAKIKALLHGIADAHGVEVVLECDDLYPETINDPQATAYLEKVAHQLLPQATIRRLQVPTMGAEDFSYYLQKVPGSFFFLGMNHGQHGTYPPLHHPAYNFNDEALEVGVPLFCHLALAYHQDHRS